MESETTLSIPERNSPVEGASVTAPDASQIPIHHKKNIYPSARHMLLIMLVLFALCVILFLIHQNGKIIYDNGL